MAEKWDSDFSHKNLYFSRFFNRNLGYTILTIKLD